MFIKTEAAGRFRVGFGGGLDSGLVDLAVSADLTAGAEAWASKARFDALFWGCGKGTAVDSFVAGAGEDVAVGGRREACAAVIGLVSLSTREAGLAVGAVGGL